MAFRATAELRPTHEREPEYNGVHSWRKAVRLRGICRVPNKTRSSASVNWTDKTDTGTENNPKTDSGIEMGPRNQLRY